MSAAAFGHLLALSVLWGGSFLFNRIIVTELPTTTAVFARVAIAALVLGLVLRLLGQSLPTGRRAWRDLAVMGIVNNLVPFALIVWGQRSLGAGPAAILNATTPMFAVALAHVFTVDDRATPAKVAGIAVGVLGVAVLVGVDALSGFADHLAADLALLGAACFYGISTLWGRRFRGTPPLATAAGQLLASSTMILPVMLVVDRPWTLPVPSMPVVAAVLALAILSTALAYVIFFRIFTIAGPTTASLVTLLVPPSAILLGWAVLGESLAPQHLAGIALIAVGLLVMDGRLLRAAQRLAGRRSP